MTINEVKDIASNLKQKKDAPKLFEQIDKIGAKVQIDMDVASFRDKNSGKISYKNYYTFHIFDADYNHVPFQTIADSSSLAFNSLFECLVFVDAFSGKNPQFNEPDNWQGYAALKDKCAFLDRLAFALAGEIGNTALSLDIKRAENACYMNFSHAPSLSSARSIEMITSSCAPFKNFTTPELERALDQAFSCAKKFCALSSQKDNVNSMPYKFPHGVESVMNYLKNLKTQSIIEINPLLKQHIYDALENESGRNKDLKQRESENYNLIPLLVNVGSLSPRGYIKNVGDSGISLAASTLITNWKTLSTARYSPYSDNFSLSELQNIAKCQSGGTKPKKSDGCER